MSEGGERNKRIGINGGSKIIEGNKRNEWCKRSDGSEISKGGE